MPLAIVVAIHAAAVSAMALAPVVRERIVAAPVMVVVREAARALPADSVPPRPLLREPRPVEVGMPMIVIAQEPASLPAAERLVAAAPATPNPTRTIDAQPIEPPRFDMAYLDNPAPAYPGVSRRMREQGRVILKVLVDAAGAAQSVEVGTSSGSARLDGAAIEAVRRWRFSPARRGAQAIAGWALVPITFALDA